MAGNKKLNKPGNRFLLETAKEKGWDLPHDNTGEFKVMPDDFLELGLEYCKECEETKRPPTIAGLCLKLRITHATYHNYAKRPEFAYEMEQVRLRVVEVWESRLFGTGSNGAQFWLRNNAGYQDRRMTELSGPDGKALETVTTVQIVGVAPPGTDFDPEAL